MENCLSFQQASSLFKCFMVFGQLLLQSLIWPYIRAVFFVCFFFNVKEEDCRIKNGKFSRTLNLPHIKWWAELSWKLNWKNLASLIYGLYFLSWKSGWRKKLGRLGFVLISSNRKVSNHSYHYEYLLDAKYSSTCIHYVL